MNDLFVAGLRLPFFVLSTAQGFSFSCEPPSICKGRSALFVRWLVALNRLFAAFSESQSVFYCFVSHIESMLIAFESLLVSADQLQFV